MPKKFRVGAIHEAARAPRVPRGFSETRHCPYPKLPTKFRNTMMTMLERIIQYMPSTAPCQDPSHSNNDTHSP
jgi:hypothetical protein